MAVVGISGWTNGGQQVAIGAIVVSWEAFGPMIWLVLQKRDPARFSL